MDFKTKSNLKRKSKIYTYVLIALTVLLILFVILLFVMVDKLKISDNLKIGMGVFILVFTIFALYIHSLAFKFQQKLIWYKNGIKKYRQLKYTNKVIELLLADKFSEAIDMYNNLVTDNDCRDFLYAFIIGSELHNTDPERKKKGHEHLENVLKNFDPNNVDLS